MPDKIIKPSYFNINNKENSILKNAKHQDNEFIDELNKIEKLTNNVNQKINNENKVNNVLNVNFTNKKK